MNLWKQKLADFLHDPPSKALELKDHQERAAAAYRQAGFIATEIGDYIKDADHTAAAADRLPFPHWRSSGLQCAFDGIRNAFRHPLSGETYRFHAEFRSIEQVFEGEAAIQPSLTDKCLAEMDDATAWRARFFAHWRLWCREVSQKDYRFALLPADTRIPDHSIWTHMQVVSALGSCSEKDTLRPAFLKFQLGPVQDFIAAARSTRDLWSGSYLLSWLMAAGLKELSARIGPDAVIFPSLKDQPLFDLHWRDDLWRKVSLNDCDSVWKSFNWKDEDLLVPNLPNVFLAVVPASKGIDLAKEVKKAICDEWARIAEKVWQYCDEKGLTDSESSDSSERFSKEDRQKRFDSQVKRFLSLSWQVTPWPNSIDDALHSVRPSPNDDPNLPQVAKSNLAGSPTSNETQLPAPLLSPLAISALRIGRVVKMAESEMPKDHRDVRYYDCGRHPSGHPKAGWKDSDQLKPDAKLNNAGLAWSAIIALNAWQLDAVRQTRAFAAAQMGGWQVGTFNNKDSLTGKEEAFAGGRVWAERAQSREDRLAHRFKKGDWIGAPTLIKRLWDLAYLQPVWGLEVPKFPHTRGIAAHDPFAKSCSNDEEEMDIDKLEASEKYFAVLAFDGDEIGKWISGEKTPPFETQLADYKDSSNQQRFGAKVYFEKPEFNQFLKAQRPLSPSYHLQFSEALGNFARVCARRVVEAYDGRLIYAGGDDVVALLPADTALECAQALRAAFRGEKVCGPTGELLFDSRHPGFLEVPKHPKQPIRRHHDDAGNPIPLLVPGPHADASVGIAIAHFKAPLQDVVRSAQSAEKRAKRQLGRGAVAVTLMKRSGEIVEWGAKWGPGLKLHQLLLSALRQERLSAKFPHRLAELLEPYLLATTPLIESQLKDGTLETASAGFPVFEIILREVDHCLARQRGKKFPVNAEVSKLFLVEFTGAVKAYLESLKSSVSGTRETDRCIKSILGLCQTVAFSARTASDPDSQPKGNS